MLAGNQIGAGLAATGFAFGLFVVNDGLLAKVGAAMLLIMSVYMVWAFKYFFWPFRSLLTRARELALQSTSNSLERQRDMNLSVRSARRLIFPAALLFALSRPLAQCRNVCRTPKNGG